ncbi:hypothetical protein PSTG_09309 [Puccinia striiformis f. sp. tritici PST-78]|uniref:Uncharacterized protein n=1 Tax=Puccinia striiformis f. sp. tritici PST-78 TaxID=1165861 RepID=A0A0L0VDV4_9BASI|nr:hypothetical protein PSTG_09309 [Puccinia striiformis f. sp. tritici PST-78]
MTAHINDVSVPAIINSGASHHLTGELHLLHNCRDLKILLKSWKSTFLSMECGNPYSYQGNAEIHIPTNGMWKSTHIPNNRMWKSTFLPTECGNPHYYQRDVEIHIPTNGMWKLSGAAMPR